MPKPTTLDQWVRFLSEEEMPVLAHTARHVAGISASTDTSIADLAQVVLMDSSMTARVLRLANSVYYNPSGKRIATVSRGIVMLGFDTVRTIALSIAMVDTLLRGRQHERVLAEMALAFHAAVQAKALAVRRGEPAAEEVFIATLLFRLGVMAFWCFPNGYEQALEGALRRLESPARAEREVLGFSFAELTAALNREWHLSELLGQALAQPRSGARVGNLDLGVRLAEAAALFGWESPQARKLVLEAAEFAGLQPDAATRLVHENARNAIQAAIDFGAEVAARLIPLPRLESEGAVPPLAPAAPERPGDPEFQLRILRELSAMLSERVNLNALLGTVLEGIYRGIGMDRAVLALVAADGQRLAARYAVGEEADHMMECFNFPIGAGHTHILAQVLGGREPIWLGRISPLWRQYLTPEITGCLGETDFFAMTLFLGGRPRGLFYADRKPSGRALDERSFEGFRHFCEQALIGITLLGARSGG